MPPEDTMKSPSTPRSENGPDRSPLQIPRRIRVARAGRALASYVGQWLLASIVEKASGIPLASDRWD